MKHKVADFEIRPLPDALEAIVLAEKKLLEGAMRKAASMTSEDPTCEAGAIKARRRAAAVDVRRSYLRTGALLEMSALFVGL
ncbi:MAG: hypothetical protein M3454_02795 [Actinomycetota bacterium]|nr:hypothetical protein [Actinomycetota bacterium]